MTTEPIIATNDAPWSRMPAVSTKTGAASAEPAVRGATADPYWSLSSALRDSGQLPDYTPPVSCGCACHAEVDD